MWQQIFQGQVYFKDWPFETGKPASWFLGDAVRPGATGAPRFLNDSMVKTIITRQFVSSQRATQAIPNFSNHSQVISLEEQTPGGGT